MEILDILRTAQGGAKIDSLANAFGVNSEAANSVTDGVIDELSRALERNTLSRGGVSDLVEMISQGNHQPYLDDDADLASAETKEAGDELLSKILGTKHQSRGVAQRVSRQSDVSSDVIEKMLPAIAAMMFGGIEKQTGDQLNALALNLGGGDTSLAPQKPLPIPGDNTNYGGARGSRSARNPLDDLSDMIRRGGRSRPGGGANSGGTRAPNLGQIVRQIFGNLLGFQSKGFVSWVIRMIVIRYGWHIVTSLLRRLFLGR